MTSEPWSTDVWRSIHASCTLCGARRNVIEYRPMKRTLIAVATAVLVSMTVVMFLGALLIKAARVVVDLGDRRRQRRSDADDDTVHVRNGSG
jgi:hypothetical protein